VYIIRATYRYYIFIFCMNRFLLPLLGAVHCEHSTRDVIYKSNAIIACYIKSALPNTFVAIRQGAISKPCTGACTDYPIECMHLQAIFTASILLQLHPNAFNCGYEAFQSHMSQPGSAPDWKEGLFLGPDLPDDHPYCVQRKLNCGPSRWPQGLDDPDRFKRISMEYYDALFQFAVLALTMDYEETFFNSLTEGAVATLRYLHYPPQPVGEAEKGLGTGAHRDYSCITLLLQDGTGGLQVLDEPTGQWLDVCCSLEWKYWRMLCLLA
jgi:hypothetical protein